MSTQKQPTLNEELRNQVQSSFDLYQAAMKAAVSNIDTMNRAVAILMMNCNLVVDCQDKTIESLSKEVEHLKKELVAKKES